MILPLRIAARYLVAKKTTNAINIITGISVLGIAIGTAALVLVLSVFNGFEDLIAGLFSKFNPDVKVAPARGKTFEPDSATLQRLLQLDEVLHLSQTLEEVAFFEYRESQDFGILKGVDSNFARVTGIDSTVVEGVYKLREGRRYLAVLGAGMRNKLTVNTGDVFEPLKVFMAKRTASAGLGSQPFRKRFCYPVGTFKIQQDFDNQYVLADLEFARDLLGYDREISALEIKLAPGADVPAAVAAIQGVVGPDFSVKDRYRQEEAFLKLMNIEKWMSFAILSLMLVLVAFNMIGSLWMIVLEKKKDIAILKSMGADDRLVRRIFLGEGLLLVGAGLLLGFLFAVVLYAIQKTYGIVPIPEGFVVDAYPISMRPIDFLAVTAVVLTIGLLAALPPALRAQRVPPIIREE
ncbi:MAG: FtsX-like permease family protein [Bacteroidetes bacterium]|nr:MAG: FtsX-like permease family protein [Bacteroidota bacterium]